MLVMIIITTLLLINSDFMMNKFGKELGEFLEYKNISIKEFADRINTTSKNLIDIIKGNIELSQNMIYNISFITGIPVNYIENTEQNYKMDKVIENYLNENHLTIKNYINRFNYKELAEKYDVKYRDSKNDYAIAKDILKYLRISNPTSLTKENNVIFYKSKNDKPELLALWLERCNRIIEDQKVEKYTKENINKLVEFIKMEANNQSFDENKLIMEFNKNGIFLAIQDDLKGTKVRGAFKVLNDKPAIYITRKHKRYADIYFALLHELAHCKSDYNRAKSGSIITMLDDNETEDYEIKADMQALDWMVPDKIYEDIKYDFNKIEKLDVVKSFYVYRLAIDNIIEFSNELYQKYNPVIDD